ITTQYNYPLKPGMKVQVSRAKGKNEFHNNLMKLVYEDAYLIVIEKMPGLLSVATDRQKERTAYHILSDYVSRRGQRDGHVHTVHRLDRDTSGLMMFAKDEKTQQTLRENWHRIVTDRRYVAVVVGEMERDAGTVVSWLTDRKLYVHSSPTDDGGQKSITHYRTIKRANGYSLVELQLETGRRNQIRVHMQDLGHPLAGDGRYGVEENNPLGRLALHAFKLCFRHPVTGEEMKFETPYPPTFKSLFVKR
ncbi:MAG: RluA family pseudouridine synthase, partial [Prevotellaceae bacterium]|nr:RluA family pseudouridine synthase [Prevotellaceae bacterium]